MTLCSFFARDWWLLLSSYLSQRRRLLCRFIYYGHNKEQKRDERKLSHIVFCAFDILLKVQTRHCRCVKTSIVSRSIKGLYTWTFSPLNNFLSVVYRRYVSVTVCHIGTMSKILCNFKFFGVKRAWYATRAKIWTLHFSCRFYKIYYI